MRKLSVAALFVAFVTYGRPAAATPIQIQAGDLVRLADSWGSTGGGEFVLTVNGVDSLITFCIQRTQFIDFTSTFRVVGVNTYAATESTATGGDGTGHDPLLPQTAFLFTAFTNHTLTGYNYGGGAAEVSSANNLQLAIWMFEDELAMDANNPFVIAANTAVNSGAWSGLGDVRALNLVYDRTGVEAQDQLAIVNPEPGSLVLLGTGLAGAAMRLRRRWKARAS